MGGSVPLSAMKILHVIILALPLAAQSPDAIKDTTTIDYWRAQFRQAETRAEALQLELNRIWGCLAKDGIPGYDPKTGDPTCTERPKPPVSPALANPQ